MPVTRSEEHTPELQSRSQIACRLLLDHFRSCATALNCCERPSASSVVLTGLTTTDVTICATDSAAVPATPPVAAVIVATPFATAVPTPLSATEATTRLSDFHDPHRPARTSPP